MSPMTADRQLYDPTPWDALNAVSNGDAAKLCACLEELAASLLFISELLDPSDELMPPLTFKDDEGAEAGKRLAERCWKRPWDQVSLYYEDDVLSQDTLDHLIAEGEDNSWEGKSSELIEAAHLRVAPPFGWYLHTVAQLLIAIGETLKPGPDAEAERQLKFQRRRRGRPTDPTEVFFRESAIAEEVQSEKHRLGKQEAAVHSVAQKYGHSRATIMRLLRSHKMRK